MGAALKPASQPADPQLPPKPELRKKPQRRWGIGAGKRYADEAAFLADVAKWTEEQAAHKVTMKEHKRLQDQLRDRSNRQQLSGAQHRKTADAMKPPEADPRRRHHEAYHNRVRAAVARCPFKLADVQPSQRVRVTAGRNSGHCGTVMSKVSQYLSVQLDEKL